ncbi:class II glutamine amidotransferase [Legionella maioricensis]|uniref:Class II glutamine amidotransferase n=1 Tax=Legionella maioricensis TaxID=2896528 RepID=A0A9X2IBB2_9GAMM|nr:class II glutamine amidotransferase [Legionella maioricensis]MCL9684784.1 class II glutamine amidotransferase [Legionella maioricensis]MCL9687814.1 class II glutamine amidotransferase [Legionella maioricensis]
MCRIVAYLGRPAVLQDILVTPKNSIVMQSLHARETDLRVNGDGFGLGWYVPAISPEPALFTSISPAWNDRNLLNLTAKTQSPCFFAHVRSASSGGVTKFNCHPFIHGEWMFMHNGEINNFVLVKRHIRHLLDDDIYDWIQGETDSEHLFALFLQLAKGRDLNQLSVVGDVLQETLQKIAEVIKEFGKKGPSYYNICMTDGQRIIATRYCTHEKKKNLTFHYLEGYIFAEEGKWLKEEGPPSFIIVSSEKFNDLAEGWEDIPPQHMMLVDENKMIQLRPL